jgi:hypothetical protein
LCILDVQYLLRPKPEVAPSLQLYISFRDCSFGKAPLPGI